MRNYLFSLSIVWTFKVCIQDLYFDLVARIKMAGFGETWWLFVLFIEASIHPEKIQKKTLLRSEYSHSVGCELDTHLAKRFSRKYAHKLKRKVMFINSIHFQKHKCIQTRKTKEWLYFLSIAYPEELSCGMRWGWPSLEDCMEFMIFDFSILSLKYYFESFIFNN